MIDHPTAKVDKLIGIAYLVELPYRSYHQGRDEIKKAYETRKGAWLFVQEQEVKS